jgi:hypothetical protein
MNSEVFTRDMLLGLHIDETTRLKNVVINDSLRYIHNCVIDNAKNGSTKCIILKDSIHKAITEPDGSYINSNGMKMVICYNHPNTINKKKELFDLYENKIIELLKKKYIDSKIESNDDTLIVNWS